MQTTQHAQAEVLKELKEGVHYRIMKDGHGVEHRIAIPEAFCDRTSGKITLEAFRVTQNFKDAERSDIITKSTFKCVYDKTTKLWFGEPLSIDPIDKALKWRTYHLRMINTFDLANPEQRKWWAMISRSSIVEGSPNQNQKPLFKVIDSYTKNKDFLQTLSVRKRGDEIISGMSFNQLVEFAPSIGINGVNYDPDTLRVEFLRYNENNAKKFLEIWDSPTRDVVVKFKKAYQLGVIQRKIHEGHFMGYSYNEYTLGISESECIAFLSADKHSAILAGVVFETNERQNSLHVGNIKVEPAPQQKPSTTIQQVDSDETTKLRAQVEALKKQLAEKNNNSGNNDIKEPEPETTQSNGGGSEYAALLAEAKSLKIKGAHLIKNPEDLRKRIEKAKQQSVASV